MESSFYNEKCRVEESVNRKYEDHKATANFASGSSLTKNSPKNEQQNQNKIFANSAAPR